MTSRHHTPLDWTRRLARAERAAVRANRQSPMDLLDAANEDSQGRLPSHPAYGTDVVT